MRSRTPRPRTAAAVAALVLAAGLSACSGGETDAAPGATEASTAVASPEELTGELVVFAAASLQDTFTELGTLLEEQNPGLTVTFNFGASSALSQQLLSGAPADVFAAANTSTMDAAAELTEAPEVFAHNSLEIVVPAGNPAGVTGLADLADPARTIALCAEEVPCGSAAVTAFEAAGLTPAPDTYEKDVTATLTKAVLGEVDAALVYRTDVISAGDKVEGIDFPEAAEALNDYPVATLAAAPNAAAARAFIALLLSSTGQDVLTAAGFDAA